jgi:hypothetical protein
MTTSLSSSIMTGGGGRHDSIQMPPKFRGCGTPLGPVSLMSALSMWLKRRTNVRLGGGASDPRMKSGGQ